MNKWVVLVWYLGFVGVCFHIHDSLFITLVRLGVIVIICTCKVKSVAMPQHVLVFIKLGVFSTIMYIRKVVLIFSMCTTITEHRTNQSIARVEYS